jgi:hypothetical protein
MYKKDGAYYWDSEEELDTAHEWLWDCLCDLSFLGLVETIIRMIFRRPPAREE